MILFITEKPDVARVLADYLARMDSVEVKIEKQYINVGADIVVTWAFGHILELISIDDYLLEDHPDIPLVNNKPSWNGMYPYLPYFPDGYRLKPKEKNYTEKEVNDRQEGNPESQLKVIARLIEQSDTITHAADADREGQAIVDNILNYLRVPESKKVYRLLLTALNDSSIEKALENVELNTEKKFKQLTVAARTRNLSDSALGINLTCILTVKQNSGLISAGRIQTPLLGVIARRQKEIANFKPKKYYIPEIVLADGTILKWESREEDTEGIENGLIVDENIANEIIENINNGLKGTVVESESYEDNEPPPLPFSLPALQVEMGKRHGLSVEETAKACQSLYEKKMQSYAGTDCRYLPESMHRAAAEILTRIKNNPVGKGGSKGTGGVKVSIKYPCWNDSKVGSHHAIIPTGERGNLSTVAEELVYNAVSDRYIAQFHKEHKTLESKIEVLFGKDTFKAECSEVLVEGWKTVEKETFEKPVSIVTNNNVAEYKEDQNIEQSNEINEKEISDLKVEKDEDKDKDEEEEDRLHEENKQRS